MIANQKWLWYEDKTAVHGCHCQDNLVLSMCKVLAIPWIWCVCLSAEIGIV